ncbi:MAG: hypothetical protein WCC17_10050 [Candidatus Nitrosopolaris sp.]
MKQKISIVLEGIVVTLVFLLASGSMVESYNQVSAYKGVHRGHHSYHDHHGYRHYGHYVGGGPIGQPGGRGHSGPGGHIGDRGNGGPGYYGHRNYGRSGPIIWHPNSPIFCHPGNPIVCHQALLLSVTQVVLMAL